MTIPPTKMQPKVRVLVVDDSALMRKILTEVLESDPTIEVVGTAADPLIAREKIKALNPDVITLDVEMPNLDGITFLERLMRLRPIPVVMVSALIPRDVELTFQALELGAVDFIPKPKIDIASNFEAMRESVTSKIKAASKAKLQTHHFKAPVSQPIGRFQGSNQIVAIGASTGGVSAILDVLSALPADAPPTVIVQHMPPGFTRQFAERLNKSCAMSVSEVTTGCRLLSGHAYIAPGDQHLVVERSGGYYFCRLEQGPAVSGHKPSVDVLFDSVAEAAGANGIGLILTGMGQDGAAGLKKMRDFGAATANQNEASCLIYGMPKAAQAMGASQFEVAIEDAATFIMQKSRQVAARRVIAE